MCHPALAFFVRLVAAAAMLAAGAAAARADPPPPGRLTIQSSDQGDGVIMLAWSGRVAGPMALDIRTAFEAHKQRGRRLVLKLNSGGGSVAEGERVIELLREIKATHEVETVVEQGHMCGSMCVFIYLQGNRRVAALSSLWLFHEISYSDPKTNKILRLDRAAWERLVDKYYATAGVSAAWTERMKPLTVASDYWQTGADLMRDQSGIVHVALGNQRERLIADRAPTKPAPEAGRETPRPPDARPHQPPQAPTPPEQRTQPPSRYATMYETKACHALVPERQVYVNTPCG